MNAAHLHIIITHLPVFASLFGFFILSYALWVDDAKISKIAYGLFIAAGIGAVIAYQSGESAEHVVEGVVTSAEPYIEAHEELALWAMISTGLLGLASVAVWGFISFIPRISKSLNLALLALSLGSLVILGITANRGGKIRHTEIRQEQTTANIQEDSYQNDYSAEEQEENDD